MNSTIAARKPEQGFTLVELAIVMIIIGLLLGGLLKGQELITNARVTSTIAAIKNIDAATVGFRDKYDGMPGDILNAATRVPSCAGTCAPAAANGNGLVDPATTFNAAPTAESQAFFQQLSGAGFLSGINAPQGAVWGGIYPQAEIGGGFHPGYAAGGGLQNQQGGAVVRSGHYLALHNTPGGGVAAAGIITPNQAFRIDNKLDDGMPGAGTVFPAGAATCINAGAYNEILDQTTCNLYIRFQQ